MWVKLWGSRGSHPRPLTTDEFRAKISSILQRAGPSDLESAESREQFMAQLPSWLFRPLGGNTSCIEVHLSDGTVIVFDAGTGIIELSNDHKRRSRSVQLYHVFFTHFHYDHIQGLPFFAPAYDPRVRIEFYHPKDDLERIVKRHMCSPYFPITMDEHMSAGMRFHRLKPKTLRLGSAEISWCKMQHPGDSFAYKIAENGRSLVYASDCELSPKDFEHRPENVNFFANADILILDAQYTLNEAIEKHDWGHSSFSLGVDFALSWKIGTLYLFHHEPQYSDKQLYRNLTAARNYARTISSTTLEVHLAEEGMEFRL